MAARPFEITRPSVTDAPRIAAIHLAAMSSNALLHAQFPTPASLAAVEGFLATYAAAQLQTPPGGGGGGALIARDPATGEVAAFARWDSPREPQGGKIEDGEITGLEGCRREFLDGYAVRAEEARGRCWGGGECYRMCYHISRSSSSSPSSNVFCGCLCGAKKAALSFSARPPDTRHGTRSAEPGPPVLPSGPSLRPGLALVRLVSRLTSVPSPRPQLCLHRPGLPRAGRGHAADTESAGAGGGGRAAGLSGEHGDGGGHV